VGYAILLVSFPAEMTRWPVPMDVDGTHTWSELARMSFASFYGADLTVRWDGYTGATALDSIRNGLGLRYTLPELLGRGDIAGTFGSRGFAWINLAVLAGGLYLMTRRIVRWHIPLAVLGGLLHRARPGFRHRPGTVDAGILRRDDADRIFRRNGPGLCRNERSRTALVRSRHRTDRVDHPHLGRLPGWLRLRRTADEPRRAPH
jgi:hypothetical protein